tara:strand:+ start:29217 stop:29585 length:369 start_codon:yes stop_codon:yes gene_type:complete
MFSTILIWTLCLGALAVVVIWAYVWKVMGYGKGKAFGDRLADQLGWKRNFFHSVLENGVTGPSLSVLNFLESADMTKRQALIELAPSLDRGLMSLEARFGPQPMIENAKPQVAALIAEWEAP